MPMFAVRSLNWPDAVTKAGSSSAGAWTKLLWQMTLGPIPGSASSEPISQSIRGVWVFTFASCPAVGSAMASGEKASVAQAIPTPDSAIFLTVVPFEWVMSERVHVLGGDG